MCISFRSRPGEPCASAWPTSCAWPTVVSSNSARSSTPSTRSNRHSDANWLSERHAVLHTPPSRTARRPVCGTGAPAGSGAMDTEATRAALDAMIAAFVAGDSDGLAASYHDDIDWLFPAPVTTFPFAGARRGKTEVFKGFALLYTDYRVSNYRVLVKI